MDVFADQKLLHEEDPGSTGHFTPISMNRNNDALSFASPENALSGLEGAIFQIKRKQLQLRLSRMDTFRKKVEDAQDAQQRYQEEIAIESLKSIHLIQNNDSKSTTTLLGSEFSAAQNLLQARMRLLEGLKSGKMEAGTNKHKIDGPWTTGSKPIPARVGTVITSAQRFT